MATSQILVTSGNIQTLTVQTLTLGSGSAKKLTLSNASTKQLSASQAFILTPQLLQATGSNSQSTAAQITAPAVVVTRVSSSTRGIRLPPASAGLTELISNAGSNSVCVFPAAGDRIESNATNVSATLAAGKGSIFFAQDSVTWRLIQGA
ncbi:MAG: hypothetical protein JWM77_560 [Rhodospirillales bacterium]|nr:hypothetical protein [Rhodospirillales bacterium]